MQNSTDLFCNSKSLFPPERHIHFKEIDSTNTEARRMLDNRPVAELEGTVITAEYQSSGKGRIEGRKFFSPANAGLYMSAILRPTDSMISVDLYTPAAGVAVCRTIEKLTGQKPGIKWVNDVFLEGKKVCGILAEGILSPSCGFEAVILGIGVNLHTAEGGFPEELKEIAGSLSDGITDSDCKLTTDCFLKELLFQLSIVLDAKQSDETITAYQDYSLLIGKQVTVLAGNSTYQAKVLEVTKKCHLIVCPVDDNGEAASSETRELLSGEVSLRFN